MAWFWRGKEEDFSAWYKNFSASGLGRVVNKSIYVQQLASKKQQMLVNFLNTYDGGPQGFSLIEILGYARIFAVSLESPGQFARLVTIPESWELFGKALATQDRARQFRIGLGDSRANEFLSGLSEECARHFAMGLGEEGVKGLLAGYAKPNESIEFAPTQVRVDDFIRDLGVNSYFFLHYLKGDIALFYASGWTFHWNSLWEYSRGHNFETGLRLQWLKEQIAVLLLSMPNPYHDFDVPPKEFLQGFGKAVIYLAKGMKGRASQFGRAVGQHHSMSVQRPPETVAGFFEGMGEHLVAFLNELGPEAYSFVSAVGPVLRSLPVWQVLIRIPVVAEGEMRAGKTPPMLGQVRVRSSLDASKCSFCLQEVSEEQAYLTCESCAAAMHNECAADHGNRCAAPGCEGKLVAKAMRHRSPPRIQKSL